jgi:hypothetical protein
MPIIIEDPTGPTPLKPVVPQVSDGAYRGVVVDTRYQPRSSLLTNVDGAKWQVNYYSQVVDTSNDLATQSLDRQAINQQYYLIQGLQINVTSALSTSQDGVSRAIGATGAGTVYPGVIPNVGDMFLADIGDGREGVFTITASDKKSFLKDALYAVEYTLISYQTPAQLADFTAKTIQTSTFVAGNLLVGKNPILASGEYTDLQLYYKSYQLLLNQYFATFFSNEFQTLIVPDQGPGLTVYDPFIVRALLSWVGVDSHPYAKACKSLNVDGDLAFKSRTVWDCISAMDSAILPMVVQEMGVAQTWIATKNPFMNGIFFSGINGMMYPIDARTDIDQQYIPYYRPGALGTLSPSTPPYQEMRKLLTTTNLNGFSYQAVAQNPLPDIVPVTIDDFYVFSQGFYTPSSSPQSNLEVLVLQALQGQPVDPTVMHRLCNNAVAWGNLERFYYVPVLLAILKTLIGVI